MNWIESLLGTARSRLSNPLAGSFILSWTVINWKTVLILLSVETPNAEKIGLLMQADYFNYWNLLILPLVFGVLLTVAIPLATWILEKRALNPIQEWRLEQRVNLTKIRAELEKLDDEWGTNEDLKSRLGESQAKNDSLRNENKILSEENTGLRSDLDIKSDFEGSITDGVDKANEPLNLNVAQEYEDWRKKTLGGIRRFISGDLGKITQESHDYADALFDKISDGNVRSFENLKNEVKERGVRSKSTECNSELERLANILPDHPDEIPF